MIEIKVCEDKRIMLVEDGNIIDPYSVLFSLFMGDKKIRGFTNCEYQVGKNASLWTTYIRYMIIDNKSDIL
jgi:hypothetical protein